MCTTRILDALTKENIKYALTEAGVVGYSVSNAVMYVKEPSALLASTVLLFMNWVNPDHDEINNPVALSLSYSVVGIAALCLALQNYKSYSKIVREYNARVVPAENAPEEDPEAVNAPTPMAAATPKASCGEKFKSRTAALLKTVGASYSWYNLVKSIPAPGFPIVAAITTGLSVPGNIYTQLALLSPKPPIAPASEDRPYHRMT